MDNVSNFIKTIGVFCVNTNKRTFGYGYGYGGIINSIMDGKGHGYGIIPISAYDDRNGYGDGHSRGEGYGYNTGKGTFYTENLYGKHR